MAMDMKQFKQDALDAKKSIEKVLKSFQRIEAGYKETGWDIDARKKKLAELDQQVEDKKNQLKKFDGEKNTILDDARRKAKEIEYLTERTYLIAAAGTLSGSMQAVHALDLR